jgi:poly-gamma-glutamate synthesis protein (capsule biosynthesis protein)
MVFCSSPRYIELLTDIGTDVMELSGDHFGDYGTDAFLETLDIYRQNKIQYYGGGLNLEDGRKPLLLEVNGNKLMFIGCNIKKAYAGATDTKPGAVLCDFGYMTAQIGDYRARGYLPISTFQYNELDVPKATEQQEIDFRTLADAGAVIVSGSQAHTPQMMEFYKDAFIHFGLGNLFFDQVLKVGRSPKQNEFIDRHVFYDGRYLGVELVTAFLEDYARPRLMKPAERTKFLGDYFNYSGWDFLQAVP